MIDKKDNEKESLSDLLNTYCYKKEKEEDDDSE